MCHLNEWKSHGNLCSCKNTLWKNPTFVHGKILMKIAIEWSYSEPIIPTDDKSINHITLNVANLKVYSLKSGIRKGYSLSSFPFNIASKT